MATNVSKEKREKLVEKINAIKTYIQTAPQDENTSNLLTYISEIEKDLKSKKYGLVFEEHKEEIDEVLETHVPVLTEKKDLFINNSGEMNFLIEGDNLASLKLLEKTHKDGIDLIYIDPPYNTGNKDFIYNDNIVDKNNEYRHSKWISFMKKRLEIAKNTLSNNGIIFISIDDNEQANLKLLCDDIFGEQNLITTFLWNQSSGGSSLSKFIRNDYEYILCYSKNKNLINYKFFSRYSEGMGDSSLINKPNRYNKLFFKKGTINFTGNKEGVIQPFIDKDFELHNVLAIEDSLNANDVYISAKWKWSQNYLDEQLEAGTRIISKTKKLRLRYVKDNRGDLIIPTKSITSDNGVGYTNSSNAELTSMDISFDYAKPVSLIKYLANMITYNNKEALVLDFFAGSGTTGHAVMDLNKEDGGNRKFILCTNNENNIAKDVTHERIKRAIEKEDYKASLKYFKVDFIPIKEKLYYEYADELLKHIKELVELENAINFNENNEIEIALTEDELDNITNNITKELKIIYIGHDVLPTKEQELLFKEQNIKINIIPEYYYRSLEG